MPIETGFSNVKNDSDTLAHEFNWRASRFLKKAFSSKTPQEEKESFSEILCSYLYPFSLTFQNPSFSIIRVWQGMFFTGGNPWNAVPN
ncbi:hypothetical protein VNO77_16114 [Canavalia gladiata]|uniref:Uncharacterized protein n=1 Tax=Canavalia gladiata TaxID=3824 RepID=A0AAN9LZV3_CANGL